MQRFFIICGVRLVLFAGKSSHGRTMADKLHLLWLCALTGGEGAFCSCSLDLWHGHLNSLPRVLLPAGLSAPLLQRTCLSVCMYRTMRCCEFLGAHRKKKKTVCLRVCEEDSRADEGQVPVSRHCTPIGRHSCIFAQGCTSSPSLGPSAPAEKVQDVLL